MYVAAQTDSTVSGTSILRRPRRSFNRLIRLSTIAEDIYRARGRSFPRYPNDLSGRPNDEPPDPNRT